VLRIHFFFCVTVYFSPHNAYALYNALFKAVYGVSQKRPRTLQQCNEYMKHEEAVAIDVFVVSINDKRRPFRSTQFYLGQSNPAHW